MATNGKIGVTTENIFPVIKKFLYSDHEIFLREHVANAVDATQKLKALAASGEFKAELGELSVRIELDESAKTLKIIDNGIGMTAEEIEAKKFALASQKEADERKAREAERKKKQQNGDDNDDDEEVKVSKPLTGRPDNARIAGPALAKNDSILAGDSISTMTASAA